MRISFLFTAVVLALLHVSTASLIVKGPSEPIVEGDSVILECVDTEYEYNMSSVHFEKMSRHMRMWYRLEADQYGFFYRRCFLYDVEVMRVDGRLLLSIPKIQSWSAGMYRCVADNTTVSDNSSMPMTLAVHYMREVSVSKPGLGKFIRYISALDDLRVSLGDDVELECSTTASETPQYFWLKEGENWLVPSSKLKLEKVRDLDSGEYTCSAQHPIVSSLIKKRTVKLTVLPEDAAWYESSSGRILLSVGLAVLVMLVIILSMTAFLCRRARHRKSKGPIDDHSQKKPIYRNSVESLSSTAGDKQPLV